MVAGFSVGLSVGLTIALAPAGSAYYLPGVSGIGRYCLRTNALSEGVDHAVGCTLGNGFDKARE
jgi:hypothetical protein